MNTAEPRVRAGARLAGPLLAAALCACATPGPDDLSAARLAVPDGHVLVWSDEFDRDGLPDESRWSYDTYRNRQGWWNNEKQYYAGPRPENAVVRSGQLLLSARLESLSSAADWGGQRFTATRLVTRGKGEWTYGFFEIRARMPCGRGSWPAIWMSGAGGRWPEDGELDILEHVGNNPERISSAVHTPAGHGGTAVNGKARVPDACTALHDYQMLWTPEGVWFGVDGVVHWHYPRRPADPRGWPFDRAQYLSLNIAVGGDLGGAVVDSDFPVTMAIDHVRVWQRRP